MRLVYDHSIFMEARIGGVLRHVLELVRGIHSLPEARDVVIDVEAGLYHAPVTAADLPPGTLHGRRVPRFKGSSRLFSVINRMGLRRTLQRSTTPGTILHETFYGDVFPGLPVVKRVVVMHDTIWEDGADEPWMAKGAALKARSIAAADGIIFVSAATRASFDRFYAPPRLAAVIHHGCELRTTRERGQPNVPGPYILYVGQRGGYKNWNSLATAFAQSSVGRTHRLVSFGSPPTQQELATAAVLGGGGRFLWRGGSDDDLADLYAAADCFVYPSHAEGFGIPLVEAARLGCPIACSDIPPFREVMGTNARYFPPAVPTQIAAAIEAAVTAGRRSPVVLAAAESCSRYTWRRTAAETLAFYRAVVDG